MLTDVYPPKHFTAQDRAAVEAFADGVGAADRDGIDLRDTP